MTARLVFLPAFVASRFRSALVDSMAQDRARFAGGRAGVLAALAVAGVLYPIGVSLAHVLGTAGVVGDSLALALRPGFDVVYSESLPFMLGAVALGLASPALGVLFMAVFVPADLLAAGASGELENYSWQPFAFGGLFARLASYGLLWILAVEIPMHARAVGVQVAGNGGTAIRTAIGTGAAAAGLVYLWATALPLLISPVFTWSALQSPQRIASDPTWYYWPILVGGAGLLGLLAAAWPPGLSAAARAFDGAAAPGRWMVYLRQALLALVLSLLLGGLISGPVELISLVAGMLLVGPVLTAILPALRVPGLIASLPRGRRFVLAAAVVLALAAGVVVVLDRSMFESDYLKLIIVLIASIGLVRVLAEGGVRRNRRAMSIPTNPGEVAA